MKPPGGKIEGEFRIKVADAAPDEPEHGADDADPEEHGDFPNSGDFPVKENDEENHQAAGDDLGLPPIQGMKITRVTREADGGGSNGKRRLHKGLPDKEEGHEASPAAGAVGFAEKDISAAGLGHGGAEFGPDEAVERGEQRTGQPGDERLRAAHGFNDQRTDHERADAHDFNHVEGNGFLQAEAALEGGL